MGKFLFVTTGESYRLPSVFDGVKYWGGGRRNRGSDETFKSVERQILASKSQMSVIEKIEKKYNITCEIFINSYNLDPYLDKLLTSIYDSRIIRVNLYPNPLPSEQSLILDTINQIKTLNLEDYEFILFVRIDFYLRDFFTDYFNICENKIKYAHVDSNCTKRCDAFLCSQTHHDDYPKNSFPEICHNIVYIPKKHFDLLINNVAWSYHNSANNVCKIIDRDDVGLFIDTYHYCSTDNEWNPLYCMVDRSESKYFYNIGYRFDTELGKKIYVENDNIYQELIHKDSIIEKLKNL